MVINSAVLTPDGQLVQGEFHIPDAAPGEGPFMPPSNPYATNADDTARLRAKVGELERKLDRAPKSLRRPIEKRLAEARRALDRSETERREARRREQSGDDHPPTATQLAANGDVRIVQAILQATREFGVNAASLDIPAMVAAVRARMT